jgi:hypothetical protein
MNKFVLLLPVSVMFLLFYFGYHYITSNEVVTNELLQNEIFIDLQSTRDGDKVTLSGNWDWTQMPDDGLVGNDYIVISIQNDDQAPFNSENFLSNTLVLLKGDQEIQSINGGIIADKVIFSFPNKLIEHESYGNRGKVELLLEVAEEDTYTVSFTYVHTWDEHQKLTFTEKETLTESMQIKLPDKHWLVTRFFDF